MLAMPAPPTPVAEAPALRWTNGVAIAEARRAAGLTQTALAAKIGVSKVAISHIEAGRTEARVATIGRIASVLGVAAGPFIRSEPEALAAAVLLPAPRASS